MILEHGDNLSPVWMADPVNRHHPLNAGRVAWWLAMPNTMGGRFFYDLMGLNSGTLTNMTGATVSGWRGTTRPGGWGHLQFAGSQYVECGNQPAFSFGTNSFSYGVWFRFTGTTASTFPLNKRTTGSIGYDLLCNAALVSGTLAARFNATTSSSWAGAGDDRWHRAVVVHDQITGALTLYGDGVVRGTGSFTPGSNGDSSQTLEIGARGGGAAYTGSLDDVSLWSRALTAAEAAADFDLSRRGYPGVLNRLSLRTWFLPLGTAANPAAALMAA